MNMPDCVYLLVEACFDLEPTKSLANLGRCLTQRLVVITIDYLVSSISVNRFIVVPRAR